MPVRLSKAVTMIVALSSLALLSGAASAEGPQDVANPTCDPGATARLTIVNNCADDIWAVITSPGTPSQIAVKKQWDWVDTYVTKENTINTGGKGSIEAATRTTLTVTRVPNPALVAGMKIKIKKAASGSDLTTTITSVSSDGVTLTLHDAGTPVTDEELWLYTGQKAFKILKKAQQGLCVPDKGAPSGNFRFAMGCPSLTDDSDPFNTTEGCIIGSAFGDAAGINTLFEPSFGCIPPLTGKQCAFNASSDAAQYPSCPGDPTSDNCGPLTAADFFDISAVDGYTFPMRVDSMGSQCSAPSKDASMLDLASCPTETKHTIYSAEPPQQAVIETARPGHPDGGISLLTQTEDETYLQSCTAPYKWFASRDLGSPKNSDIPREKPEDTFIPQRTAKCEAGACNSVSFYGAAGCDNASCTVAECLACPGGSGPQQKVGPTRNGELAIQNTNFVQQVRALGYTGYTWQYDDGIGGQTCDAGAQMTVTLCPSGSSPKPYLKNQLWTFSTSTGTCSTDGTTGAPDEVNTFGSLFACQKANMKYTCTDLTDADPFKLPVGVWAANAAATLSPTPLSRTYKEFTQKQLLVCQPTGPLTIPPSPEYGGGTVSVPNCTYYGAPRRGLVCPKPK